MRRSQLSSPADRIFAILEAVHPNAAKVYGFLAPSLGSAGSAYYSLSAIARGTGLSVATVKRLLRVLRSGGAIDWKISRNWNRWEANRYFFPTPAGETAARRVPIAQIVADWVRSLRPGPKLFIAPLLKGSPLGLRVGLRIALAGLAPKVILPAAAKLSADCSAKALAQVLDLMDSLELPEADPLPYARRFVGRRTAALYINGQAEGFDAAAWFDLVSRHRGPWLISHPDSPDIRTLAAEYLFAFRRVSVKKFRRILLIEARSSGASS
ncbi:MAG TPA: hypothetical protein VFW83_03405 [Bryobacteraceae bacterium]|nr:hypothetical protein [Bryobacteraceae bacterium]